MRIATYNVRNLFSAAEARTDGSTMKSASELSALAATIGALNADVLLLQEVGSQEVLAELNDSLAGPYPFFDVLPGNSNRGIHLGVMSREPYRLESHRDRQLVDEDDAPLLEYDTEEDALQERSTVARIQRDLMLIEVELDGFDTLALFNVHLKSKTNRDWRLLAADVIRRAECRLIAGLVSSYLQKHPARSVVIGGDFNDTRRSEVLSPFFNLPFDDPLGEELARSGRNPSTYWPKRRMRLDYLLLSKTGRPLLLEGSSQIHKSQRGKRASDHYPVSLDLDYTDLIEGM